MKLDENPYRILVVEDNPGDYLLIEDYLQEHIFNPHLTHVKKFKDVAPLLESSSEYYDILLLDLSLPDIDKEALIEKSEVISQSIPVIILTGYTDLDFATKSLSKGVSDYLIKDTINDIILYKSIIYAIERHRFIQTLRRSEKKYMELFHLSPAPMFVYDQVSLRFLDVNNAAISHYGYSNEEFLNLRLDDIDIQMAKVNQNGNINSSLLTMNFLSRTTQHRKKNGRIIDVEIVSNVIEFKDNKAIITLAKDITERLLHLKAIEEQNKKLKDIAWTQSHIVRAPVARMIGLIELLKMGNLDPSEQYDVLQHVLSSAEEIDGIIKDIVHKSQTVINTK